MVVSTGCSQQPDQPEWPWADATQFYHRDPMPGVPVIRVPESESPQHDGALDDASWQKAREFHDFALANAMGSLDFPTSVRVMRCGRILWLGLDLRIPPGRDGKLPDKVMERELVEIWLDRGPTRHTFYQIMFKPDGTITSDWVPKSTLDNGFVVKTIMRPDGWTAEVRVDIDVMSDFVDAPGLNIGFNMARNCAHGWASLAQVVGHVHKPAQFWTLDMTGELAEVAPVNIYRNPFRPGTDVRVTARTLVDAWAQVSNAKRDRTWARMEVMMDRLRRGLASDEKDSWGREGEIAILAWRALTGWRSAQGIAMPKSVGDLASQLADHGKSTYPATYWREEAYISEFDNTPQPYAIRVPESYEPKSPIPLVMFLHGSGQDHYGGGAIFERYEQDVGIIEVRTKSRQCNWYEPIAMRDVLDVIEDVRSQYDIDPDRIYLTGYSAGAYAVLQLGTEHPERFAAIVPVAGSIIGKTPETLRHMPILWVYGANDYAMGITEDTAVVPLELRATGSIAQVSLYPATGHGVTLAGYEPWMLKHRRVAVPESVSCYTDESNPGPVRNYWVSILRLADADNHAAVRADLCKSKGSQGLQSGDVVVQTANVAEFSLDLDDLASSQGQRPQRLAVDGKVFDAPDAPFVRFVRPEAAAWTAHGSATRPMPDPTLYRAGGIENLYAEGSALIVAPGDLVPWADNLSHRIIMGRSIWVNIPVRRDTDVTDEELRTNHLFLVGGSSLNKVTARLAAMEKDWPLPVEGGAVALDKKRKVSLAESIVAVATFNPMNRARRVWAIVTDAKDAFRPDSILVRGRGSKRRRPDIQVIDVKTNAVIEQRLLTDEWKPRGYAMGLD